MAFTAGRRPVAPYRRRQPGVVSPRPPVGRRRPEAWALPPRRRVRGGGVGRRLCGLAPPRDRSARRVMGAAPPRGGKHMTALAPLVLLGWIAAAMMLFARLPARRALIAVLVLGVLLLPEIHQ